MRPVRRSKLLTFPSLKSVDDFQYPAFLNSALASIIGYWCAAENLFMSICVVFVRFLLYISSFISSPRFCNNELPSWNTFQRLPKHWSVPFQRSSVKELTSLSAFFHNFCSAALLPFFVNTSIIFSRPMKLLWRIAVYFSIPVSLESSTRLMSESHSMQIESFIIARAKDSYCQIPPELTNHIVIPLSHDMI